MPASNVDSVVAVNVNGGEAVQRRDFTRLLVSAPLLVACSDMTGADEGDVAIRVRNTGPVDISGVVISFPQRTVEYGDIAAGDATDYVDVGRAYAYAGVRVVYEGEEITLTPIDYVGEELLESGRWTYDLEIDPAGRYLAQRAVRG